MALADKKGKHQLKRTVNLSVTRVFYLLGSLVIVTVGWGAVNGCDEQGRLLTGPTVPVLCQYLLVWELLRTVILNPLQSDRFIWRWSPDGKYSASSAYRAFFVGSSSLFFFSFWAMENKGQRSYGKQRPPPKVKFFFWLALHRRL